MFLIEVVITKACELDRMNLNVAPSEGSATYSRSEAGDGVAKALELDLPNPLRVSSEGNGSLILVEVKHQSSMSLIQ